MTLPPGTQVRPVAETANHRVRLLPPARYRHPGDVIRLIIAGLVLAGALAITAATHATYAGASAAAVTALTPPALASRVLAGVVQAVLIAAAVAAVIVTLRYRRVRLVTGTASPMEAALAFAAGVTAGAGMLVLLGVPDRRIGPEGIAVALGSASLPVTSVEPAGVEAKGSRPFVAAAEGGQRLFIKILGSDQRDADLLYRAYPFTRLRGGGD